MLLQMLTRKSLTVFLPLVLYFSVTAYSLPAEAISIDVPYYAQGNNAPWADETLGIGSTVTIRTHGCALTTIAMVFSHFTGEKITPSAMNRWLKLNEGFEDDPDTSNYSGQVVLNWPSLADFGDGWVYTRFDWRAKPADILLDRVLPGTRNPRHRRGTVPWRTPLCGAHRLRRERLHHASILSYLMNTTFDQGLQYPRPSGVPAPSRNIYGIRVLYPNGFLEE